MKGTSYGNGKSNHNESVIDQNCAKIITSNVEHFYHQSYVFNESIELYFR